MRNEENYFAYLNEGNNEMSTRGPIGILCTQGNEDFVSKVNTHLYNLRSKETIAYPADHVLEPGYLRNDYIIDRKCVRFSSGEAKVSIGRTVRGHDLFILADVLNREPTYKLFGKTVPMSPDDHLQDVKRLILAACGKAERITVIMPYLYQGRQDFRQSRESLDCAQLLKELAFLGANSVVSFEPHDPRVSNAIPRYGIEFIPTTELLMQALLMDNNGIIFDKEHLSIVSPDEAGMKRAMFYSNILKVQLSTFYRKRDYSTIVGGRNPVKSLQFLGEDLRGKDVIIIDDMILSGNTVLETAQRLKDELGAKNVFCLCSYPVFSNGIEAFNKAYKSGLISKVYGTNLIYRTPELLASPWYVDADCTHLTAELIDAINHNASITNILDQATQINELLNTRIQKDKENQA